jgi:DNA (cytosine-5)-methyltransferase 1
MSFKNLNKQRMSLTKQIPIIDLFAGPGGLGEGFSAYRSINSSPIFKIKLSIEKDNFAHKTLLLRAFFRKFNNFEVPMEYYEYLEGKISEDYLFDKYPTQALQASDEAWCIELGGKKITNENIDLKIEKALDRSKNWVLIGGPPCQAYSLAGRSRMRGGDLEKFETDERHFLYKEYLRILAVHQPPVFIMENVKGLLSAELNDQNIFQRILEDLSNPIDSIQKNKKSITQTSLKYQLLPIESKQGNLLGDILPSDFVVHAENHGIPQMRHRIIILGIRSDISKTPNHLRTSDEVAIEDVINDLPKLRSGLSKEIDNPVIWSNTIKQIQNEKWFSIDQTIRVIKNEIIKTLLDIDDHLDKGAEYIPYKGYPNSYANWYKDSRLMGICNHSARSHIKYDLYRYLYSSVFSTIYQRSPQLREFPVPLLPNHKNVAEALIDSKFNDRFRVQVKGRPSTTIVSHISKDGHYYIHYDPSQCRSLTVREAARLQTFPDNYFFVGPRTEQYKQVGNAVPPLLAQQIAEIVADLLT